MRLVQVYEQLKKMACPVLKTHEVAGILNISKSHASQILRRLSINGIVQPIKRGLWLIDKNIDGFELARYITAPFPSYISLQSALYLHEMISQIPETIYLITIARSQHIKTPIADYSLHHIDPRFFFGYTVNDDTGIALATPEKALIDYLYLTPSKIKYFKSLPELTLPKTFDVNKAYEIINKISSKRTKTLVNKKFAYLNKYN